MGSGRKKEFDEQVALNTAMEVFWAKGYAGTAISDLTKSMGINKPSMYNTFGNKEALFVKALENYVRIQIKTRMKYLSEPGVDLKQRLKNYMMSVVSRQCGSNNPKGCFVVMCQGEVLGKNVPAEASAMLNQAGEKVQTNLERLLKSDAEAKELGLNENAALHALSLATTLRGTASMARTGKSAEDLEPVIDASLKGIGF